PFPSELVAARRGSRVAWVFDSEGRRNVWVAEGPQFQARQLTRYDKDDGQELTDLSFSADGNWIVFVRGGDKNRAGEVPNPTSDSWPSSDAPRSATGPLCFSTTRPTLGRSTSRTFSPASRVRSGTADAGRATRCRPRARSCCSGWRATASSSRPSRTGGCTS